MTNELANDLHAQHYAYDKAVRNTYWAHYVPLFSWAKGAGLNASDLAMQAQLLPGTVYHGLMALNKGVNRKIKPEVSAQLLRLAKQKGVQL
jgi:hypothetical protein